MHLISHPEAMKLCVGLGMHSELLMTTLLRIMANLMRPDASGPAEIGFRAMELVPRLLPDTRRAGELRPPEHDRAVCAPWWRAPCRRGRRGAPISVTNSVSPGQSQKRPSGEWARSNARRSASNASRRDPKRGGAA